MESDLNALAAELRSAALIDEPGGRALEIIAILDEAIGDAASRPVVVGGMAVYVWTENDAFLTVDIDIVVPSSPELSAALEGLGFRRATDQRHWELPETDILIEAPASRLDPDAVVESIATPSGRTVSILSHADLLLDRLDEFQATGHQAAARQVLVLTAGLEASELSELQARATRRRLAAALAGMASLAEDVRLGRRPEPDTGEWHELARHFEQAEYGRGQR